VCVARELTKKFEEYRRDTPSALLEHFEKHPPKGEITIVIPSESTSAIADKDSEIEP
jgi:16S rRNA (cytidine1402-2'-O)-methyltransferase